MSRSTTLFVTILVLMTCHHLPGEVTFLPPTPYLSLDDSPFDVSAPGNQFVVEDFEDGLAFGSPLPPWLILNTPGPMTDSVDADDGTIDGFGTAGHSLSTLAHTVDLSNPPTWNSFISLEFNDQFIPTRFGFAWTDGMVTGRLVVHVTEMDARRTTFNFGSLMDSTYTGETAEDRFIGVVSDVGIKLIEITHKVDVLFFVNQFEIDHIQFGMPVSEPTASAWSATAIALVIGAKFFRRLRLQKGVQHHEVSPPPRPRLLEGVTFRVVACFWNHWRLGSCWS